MAVETSSFVRKLAHNDAATRSAAFDSLCSFLTSKSLAKLSFLELKKIWKGLYFSMWFCDKPIPQQDLAGNLGKLFSEVVTADQLEAFHQAFWAVILKEWHSIDKWRLDKYLMLVRRVLRHLLFRLASEDWTEGKIDLFLSVLNEYPLGDDVRFPQSLTYHVCDILLDEIEYVVFKDFRSYSEENDADDDEDSNEEDEDEDADEDADKNEKMNDAQTKNNGSEATSMDVFKDLSEEELAARKKAVATTTPIASLIAPFQKLAVSAKNKALRAKIQEEILNDERLKQWGVLEIEEDEGSGDEWTGF